MALYRKKPIVVEAFQVPKVAFQLGGALYLPLWARPHVWIHVTMGCVGEMFVKTLEGNMLVSNGDWLIQGVNGEVYPCKPDIFVKTYEKVG